MKKIIIIILVMFIASVLNAEKIKFDLTKYKAPEIKRRSLELDFDLTNNYNNDRIAQNKLESISDSLNVMGDKDYNYDQ